MSSQQLMFGFLLNIVKDRLRRMLAHQDLARIMAGKLKDEPEMLQYTGHKQIPNEAPKQS